MAKVVFMINSAAAAGLVPQQEGLRSFIRHENGQKLRWDLRVLDESLSLLLIERLQNGWALNHLKSVIEEAVKQPDFQRWRNDGVNTYLWIHKGDSPEAAAPGKRSSFEDLNTRKVFEHVMLESRVNAHNVDLNRAWEDIKERSAKQLALAPVVEER